MEDYGPAIIVLGMIGLGLFFAPLFTILLIALLLILGILFYANNVILEDPILELSMLEEKVEEKERLKEKVEEIHLPAWERLKASPSFVFLFPTASFLTSIVMGIGIAEQKIMYVFTPRMTTDFFGITLIMVLILDCLTIAKIFSEVWEIG